MVYLLGGFIVLCGVLLLAYLFVNADPKGLARSLKWVAIGVGALAVVALFVFAPLAAILTPIAVLMPGLIHLRRLIDRLRPPARGQVSSVTTDYLRMSLDHDTGEMTGTVLAGRFAGSRVEELGRDELFELLRECRAGDEHGARLIEAYLDRLYPSWQEEFAGARGRAGAASSSGEMSLEEAYEILGLAPGAGEDLIREAHHRLMKKVHPDHGGSDYLATKINRARDVLMNRG